MIATRIEREAELLQKRLGGRSNVRVQNLTVDGVTYSGVTVNAVRLNDQKYGVTRGDLLILVPPTYPEVPPVGCYLNFKWKTEDRHFTQRAFYKAPDLKGRGWYWYCVHFRNMGDGSWLPSPDPTKGHNLNMLYTAYMQAVNSQDEELQP